MIANNYRGAIMTRTQVLDILAALLPYGDFSTLLAVATASGVREEFLASQGAQCVIVFDTLTARLPVGNKPQ